MPDAPRPSAFDAHDHAECIASALEAARARCAAQGLRLTRAREATLRILLESHKALGAYEVLERLRAQGLGSQPPVAYRALEFLTANGFAHKIEKLSAFVACAHSHAPHAPTFLICTGCGRVGEIAGAGAARWLEQVEKQAGFSVAHAVLELEGLCPNCAKPG